MTLVDSFMGRGEITKEHLQSTSIRETKILLQSNPTLFCWPMLFVFQSLHLRNLTLVVPKDSFKLILRLFHLISLKETVAIGYSWSPLWCHLLTQNENNSLLALRTWKPMDHSFFVKETIAWKFFYKERNRKHILWRLKWSWLSIPFSNMTNLSSHCYGQNLEINWTQENVAN